MEIYEELNKFFVSCFYSILNAEERNLEAITNGKLSLKEIHVIEAVFKTLEKGENNFSNIAKTLGVTLGTLTTAFSKLEKKGYLVKQQDQDDKRIFYVFPTRLAEMINNEHTKFHQTMIDGIIKTLPPEEREHLIVALKLLSDFFNNLKVEEQEGY